jgi:hypothetical protein
VTTIVLRPMTAVKAEPMIVGHNYLSKEILLMHIAEEANLHSVEAATNRSCDKQVFFQGRAGAVFTVKARHSAEKNWTVKEYVHWTVTALPPMNLDEVYEACDDGDNDDDDEEKDDNQDFYSDDYNDFDDCKDDGEDGEDIIGEEGDGDGNPKAKKRRKRKTTPKR